MFIAAAVIFSVDYCFSFFLRLLLFAFVLVVVRFFSGKLTLMVCACRRLFLCLCFLFYFLLCIFFSRCCFCAYLLCVWLISRHFFLLFSYVCCCCRSLTVSISFDLWAAAFYGRPVPCLPSTIVFFSLSLFFLFLFLGEYFPFITLFANFGTFHVILYLMCFSFLLNSNERILSRNLRERRRMLNISLPTRAGKGKGTKKWTAFSLSACPFFFKTNFISLNFCEELIISSHFFDHFLRKWEKSCEKGGGEVKIGVWE